jgi:hypothetical protein
MSAMSNYMRARQAAEAAMPTSSSLLSGVNANVPISIGMFSNVSSGDVVWCRFPFHTAPRAPGEKARPCLVLEVRHINRQPHVLVAYGTTKNLEERQRGPGDIFIAPCDGEHYKACGLAGPGKFRLCQTALLPVTDQFFPRPPFLRIESTGRPVDGIRLGRFTPELIEVVHHAHRELRDYQSAMRKQGLVPTEPLGPMSDDRKTASTRQDHLRRGPAHR